MARKKKLLKDDELIEISHSRQNGKGAGWIIILLLVAIFCFGMDYFVGKLRGIDTYVRENDRILKIF